MDNLVIMKEQQAVTTSLQVAETFEKRHDHVLRDLDELKEGVTQNWGDLFWEDTYIHPQNKQSYRMIFMNRDGFTLLAMGFTGKKALEFKLKYIKAFNDMETHIKKQLDMSNLSPELQLMANLVNNMAKQELAQKQLNEKVDSISEIVALNTTDWRKEANALINKVVRVMGNTAEAHKEVRSAIFTEVDRRAGASLETRLTNKRRRMADEGTSKSKRDNLTKVDVISDDKKLVEIYVAVVKEFAIKYGVYKREMAK
ncbi:Rha family transcriptional regulator [Trichococcus flocculiformis]|uniref:Rha family transcriptional regulator n=1 Tax=Trichococcus flocculiformis TaxID=82803 RepID=UPI003DA2D333